MTEPGTFTQDDYVLTLARIQELRIENEWLRAALEHHRRLDPDCKQCDDALAGSLPPEHKADR